MTRSTLSPRLGLTLALGVLAAGCFPEPELCNATEIPIDSDGWPEGGCSAEICDGLDNDCDGQIDEGFPDADGDGVAECEPLTEDCDGVDNDFDGQVDEGYPDYDRDGVADCVDLECVTDSAAATTLPGPPVCGSGPISHDAVFWDPDVEEVFLGVASSSVNDFAHSCFTPVVSPLVDTDGDGVVSETDQPMVLFRSFRYEESVEDNAQILLAIDPTDSTTVYDFTWGVVSLLPGSGVAVADLSGDGTPEVLMVQRAENGTVRVVAVPNTGAGGSMSDFVWESVDRPTVTDGVPVQPVVADLDGDGDAEVIVADLVVNGEDGTTHATLELSESTPYTLPAVGDIDLDGEQEIVVGPTVFRADGSEYWSQSRVLGAEGQFSAIVQADSDEEGEVVFLGAGRYAIFEHDGTLLAEANITSNNSAGPPCVADFDGDGTSEIAFGMNSRLWVRELTGGAIWDEPISDLGGSAGCSAFDFDNDGSYEVILADRTSVNIFDGATGTVLWTEGLHSSDTFFEYPTVADVDLDGSADIVLASSYQHSGVTTDWAGLRVLRHPTGLWAPSESGWPIHDYAYSNISPTGILAGPEEHYWDTWNLLRAIPGDPALPDLTVEIVDVCESGCEDFSAVQVSVQPFNQGSEDVGAGQATVTIYGESADGTRTELASEVYPSAIPALSGGASAELVFTYGAYLSASTVNLVAVIERTTGGPECDTTNNEDVWTWAVCF